MEYIDGMHHNIWLNFEYHVLLFLLVGYYQTIRSCSWGPEPSCFCDTRDVDPSTKSPRTVAPMFLPTYSTLSWCGNMFGFNINQTITGHGEPKPF